ncbi:hypothetical protein CesoFtcFv8_018575 [Champsocephalus esox]|uniref:Uncharacterized protein n=1 Tax=Champsocephalus esox TaxID=159716 RepID=A0AAN8BHS9_9TELE|nr:hypothetical protein CesoFtcFv8_018575 [Champsocephalus esox]
MLPRCAGLCLSWSGSKALHLFMTPRERKGSFFKSMTKEQNSSHVMEPGETLPRGCVFVKMGLKLTGYTPGPSEVDPKPQ